MRASKMIHKPAFYGAAYLILVKRGKVLLQKRSKQVFKAGFYGLPAGHIEGEETVFSALKREVREEIGITVTEKTTELVHVMHRISADRIYFDFFFTTNTWKGEIQNCEPDKHDEIEWFPLNNLPKKIIPYLKRTLTRIDKEIFFSEDKM